MFFRWLSRNNYILYNPSFDLELPRVGRSLPRQLLNLKEVETVINQVDLSSLIGIRDRAILETLFCTGMRRSELVNLHLRDIDLEGGTIIVRMGKGKKDRYTILSKKLLPELKTYWCKYHPGKWLFPGQKAERHMSETAAQMAFYLAKKKPV